MSPDEVASARLLCKATILSPFVHIPVLWAGTSRFCLSPNLHWDRPPGRRRTRHPLRGGTENKGAVPFKRQRGQPGLTGLNPRWHTNRLRWVSAGPHGTSGTPAGELFRTLVVPGRCHLAVLLATCCEEGLPAPRRYCLVCSWMSLRTRRADGAARAMTLAGSREGGDYFKAKRSLNGRLCGPCDSSELQVAAQQ